MVVPKCCLHDLLLEGFPRPILSNEYPIFAILAMTSLCIVHAHGLWCNLCLVPFIDRDALGVWQALLAQGVTWVQWQQVSYSKDVGYSNHTLMILGGLVVIAAKFCSHDSFLCRA